MGCKEEERASVIEATLGVALKQFYDNKTLITEGGLVGVQSVQAEIFNTLYRLCLLLFLSY